MIFKKKSYEEIEKEMENQIEIDKTDEDILQNPQEELKVGIETEEYDVVPNFQTTKEELMSLEEKEGIEFEYSFNGEEVTEGLKLFQKDTIYKRNLIYSCLLLVIFSMYVIGIVKDPSNLFNMFLSTMCIAVMAFIWYTPFAHIKKTAKAANENNLRFNMTVYDDCVKIGEENGSFVLKYNKEITKVYETIKLFLICAGKERIFIVPKRCLKDGQRTEIKELLQLTMQENYIKKF